jgi:hypothetical protein
MKYYQTGHDEPKEFWLACDANGQITKARWHIPGWDSPEDGAKVVVWKDGKAQIWFKKKDSVVTVWEQRAVNEMLELLIAFDPKNRVQQLIKLESEGIVTLTFDEPKDKSKPITVTVDYRSGRTGREVLTINQGTFLVEKDERFAIEDGDYCLTETHEFLGYNQPIDDGMFQLAAVSPDTLQVDQTNPDIGLPKGDLTDEEIAEKVARSFYKALIAKDYAMAGSLLGGMPGDRLRDMLESKGLEFVRIVSLGPVGPHPISATRGLVVPGTLELHVNGQLISQPFDRLGVRPVHGQPDRWAIFGGF